MKLEDKKCEFVAEKDYRIVPEIQRFTTVQTMVKNVETILREEKEYEYIPNLSTKL